MWVFKLGRRSLLLNRFIQIFFSFNGRLSTESAEIQPKVPGIRGCCFLMYVALQKSLSLYGASFFFFPPVFYQHALLKAHLCWNYRIASLCRYSSDGYKTKVEQSLFDIWALITTEAVWSGCLHVQMLLVRNRRLLSLCPAAFMSPSLWDRFPT